jgi:hypothetical protein
MAGRNPGFNTNEQALLCKPLKNKMLFILFIIKIKLMGHSHRSILSRLVIPIAIIALLSCICIGAASADTADHIVWDKTISGQGSYTAKEIRETPDGGYIVAGYTTPTSGGKNKAYLLKLDAAGTKVLEKTYGTTDSEFFNSVLPVSDGYICAGGVLGGTPKNNDIRLVKIDKSGIVLWSKTFGTKEENETIHSIIAATDGGYILMGRLLSGDKLGYDVHLMKVDTTGKLVWEKTIDYGNHVECNDIAAASDGGYVITGSIKVNEKLDNVFLLKTDKSGNKAWETYYGGLWYDRGYSVVQADDGYMILGDTTTYGNGDGDLWLIKTDKAGKEQWNRTIGDKSIEEAATIMKTIDGGYILGGSTTAIGNGNLDYYMVKVDKLGKFQWDAAYGKAGYDQASFVIQDKAGDYLLLGNSLPGGSNSDIYIVKSSGGAGLNSHLNWGGSGGSTNNGGTGNNTNSGGSGTNGDGSSSGGGFIASFINWIKGLLHI